ncbi:alpha/beta fold hydrolase [Vagococcus hydrophili]|uniref:Alpha/beta hydrolase n=1 Tax=Vagococcus hydrophili TaxID=2714947 RepID=A0A6G8ARS0_9ENTE|nr:alpha/beta hydrolase [Vagococcus hydrophili]QIL47623.1 alpha/beta hydrolase [Vagococcus hydrophili]
MKKAMKIIGFIILGMLTIIILFFAGLFVTNKIKLHNEKDKIANYGEAVDVNGENMRVSISGKGKETIVLLPGFMTASPVIDFKQLTDELEKTYQVVVVEPLGYGLSDDTKKERSVDNLVEEVHAVLESKGIKKYTLMAHSISGVYSLEYIQKYPNEVEAFVGIDSSLPSQGKGDDNQEGVISFLSHSGLFRLFADTDEGMLNLPNVTPGLKEQYKYLSFKNIASNGTMNEAKAMPENFKKTKAINYPEALPVMYFLATESTEPDADWLKIHKDMIKNSQKSEIKILEGGHYLHHTKAKEISEMTQAFLKE